MTVHNSNINITMSDKVVKQRAESVRKELERGHWQAAKDLFLDIELENDDLRSVAMHGITTDDGGKPVPLSAVEEWVAAEPDNPTAHLLRANLLIAAAWTVRTSHLAAVVTELQFAIFRAKLQQAEQALQTAMELSPNDPLPYSCSLTAAMGLSKPKAQLKEIFAKFQEHVTGDPHNAKVHKTMLYTLTPKWGGSLEELFEFARSTTIDNANNPPPPGHAVWTMVPRAHLYAWEDFRLQSAMMNGTNTLPEAQSYWLDPTVQQDILRAYQRYRGNGTKKVQLSPDLENSVSNVFAYCLWKVRYYAQAHYEMVNVIRDKPTEDPWDNESQANWRAAYQRAKRQAATQRGHTVPRMMRGAEIV